MCPVLPPSEQCPLSQSPWPSSVALEGKLESWIFFFLFYCFKSQGGKFSVPIFYFIESCGELLKLSASPQNSSSGFTLLFMGGKEMVFHHFILFFPLVILFFCELVRVVQEPSRNNTTLHLKSLLKHWRTYPSCDQMGLDYHVTWLFMDRFQSQPNQFITELD